MRKPSHLRSIYSDMNASSIPQYETKHFEQIIMFAGWEPAQTPTHKMFSVKGEILNKLENE